MEGFPARVTNPRRRERAIGARGGLVGKLICGGHLTNIPPKETTLTSTGPVPTTAGEMAVIEPPESTVKLGAAAVPNVTESGLDGFGP